MTRLVAKQKTNFQPSECHTCWLQICHTCSLLTPGQHTHTHTQTERETTVRLSHLYLILTLPPFTAQLDLGHSAAFNAVNELAKTQSSGARLKREFHLKQLQDHLEEIRAGYHKQEVCEGGAGRH